MKNELGNADHIGIIVALIGTGTILIFFIVGLFLCFTENWGFGLFMSLLSGIGLAVIYYAFMKFKIQKDTEYENQ